MKRLLLLGLSAVILPAAAIAQGTVFTRAWCKEPSHGRNIYGGYGWISEVFSGPNSEACWRYANGHKQQSGHQTGCSYVNPRTGETQ